MCISENKKICLLSVQRLPRVFVPWHKIAEAKAQTSVDAKRKPYLIFIYISENNKIHSLNVQRLQRVFVPWYKIAEAKVRPIVDAKRKPCLILMYMSGNNKKQHATAA